MKKFILNLLIFCLLPLPILFGLQWIVDSGLKKSRQEMFSEWNDIYAGRINADLLVMGSSRAWVHYSPEILDKQLNLNSYNLGIDGWTFPMQKERFKIYLKYNKIPRYIVHNLDSFILNRGTELYNADQFLPYLDDVDIRRATTGYKGEFGLTQYYFPLFKYNSNPGLALTGFLNFFGLAKNESGKVKGYQGQELTWDNSFEKFKKENPNGVRQSIDSNIEIEFRDYLKFCNDNGIKVFLVYSPEYIEAQNMTINRDEIIGQYQKIANDFGVPFLDYSKNPISFDKKYFYNSQHLNKNGAEMFTQVLAEDLLKLK